MKVRYTPAALEDLAGIAEWLAIHYPTIAPAVERRIRRTVFVIGRWPGSAQRSDARTEVRAAVVGKYPYKIFYRIADDVVEVLHIHHAARRPWDGVE